MAELFDREISLNVAGTLIRTRFDSTGKTSPILRVDFKVQKSLKKAPNKSEFSVYNLNLSNRIKFQEKYIPTVLEAGYVGNTFNIFEGVLSYGQTVKKGPDWITTIQSSDGGEAFTKKRINLSIKGPVNAKSALEKAAAAMGIDIGNLREKASSGSVRETFTELVNGVVFSGKAEQQFDKIAKVAGYDWSIQNGALLLLAKDETISPDVSVVLSSTSGLIGNPEIGENGYIKARSLIQPGLEPGRRIRIETKNEKTTGFFRVEKYTAIGDTQGNNWYIDVEAKSI